MRAANAFLLIKVIDDIIADIPRPFISKLYRFFTNLISLMKDLTILLSFH